MDYRVRRLVPEFLGTFWLVLCGCGSVTIAAQIGVDGHSPGIGLLGTAFAFGLAVLTGTYAFAHLSGAHFNPAVSLGLWVGGRFQGRWVLPYILVQVLGAISAGYVLAVIANGAPYFTFDAFASAFFASNGYGDLSPGGYSWKSAFLIEAVLTGFFVVVIMSVTGHRTAAGWAPIAIGFALMLIHLVGIPVTNASVNPARSTGAALFAHDEALRQLWLFWLAPLLGGAVGGLIHRCLARGGTSVDAR